jgi:hypothetical protein
MEFMDPQREDVQTQAAAEDEPSQYCPVCSARLVPNHCKLVCERCGYFMSCAEFH